MESLLPSRATDVAIVTVGMCVGIVCSEDINNRRAEYHNTLAHIQELSNNESALQQAYDDSEAAIGSKADFRVVQRLQSHIDVQLTRDDHRLQAYEGRLAHQPSHLVQAAEQIAGDGGFAIVIALMGIRVWQSLKVLYRADAEIPETTQRQPDKQTPADE